MCAVAATTSALCSNATEQLELSYLLANLRKSIELWFFTASKQQHSNCMHKSNESLREIVETFVQILLHELQLPAATAAQMQTAIRLHAHDLVPRKLLEDFEYLCCTAHIRCDTHNDAACSTSPKQSAHHLMTVEQFLRAWTLCNLQANCLTACTQALVAEQELLQSYYTNMAFLRHHKYATAAFICISALELQQYSLLSQVNAELYSASKVFAAIRTKHRRTTSHPNFSTSPTVRTSLSAMPTSSTSTSPDNPKVFATFRKIKSSTQLTNRKPEMQQSASAAAVKSKRVVTASSAPQPIPKTQWLSKISSSCSNSSFSSEDALASTSAGSSSCKMSDSLANSSNSSNATTKRIQLIKCDDIKIWTDQTEQLRQQERSVNLLIPATAANAQCKNSSSPIGSLLSNLFGSTPKYSSWCLDQSTANTSSLRQCEASDALNTPVTASSSLGVLNAFLPIYGKKLQTRKKPLFDENGISTLDYSNSNASDSTNISSNTLPVSSKPPTNKTPPKSSQSLTAFLQMQQLTRYNTELEKENAHFRISEAIITAIEHIKWAKLEPDKTGSRRNKAAAATATDWLHNQDTPQQSCSSYTCSTQCSTSYEDDASEYMPSVELDESCLDALSAEVVGLSLISKFNEKHVPKVSELKWLVSEHDTPQQLLPMPDDSNTSNPDENIMPSRLRGTNYWAPPRQQIIFTEHPVPNRKQQLQKQSYRCATCGMRVSQQFAHSFRYCHYLGKYHCTGCHRNQLTIIPARVLQHWDFKGYTVSLFAYRLLEQMQQYPLFYVPDLNPALYICQKTLLQARNKRLQLKFVKDFIKSCRFSLREQALFAVIPEHITEDVDIWSMTDFTDTFEKKLQNSIDALIGKCEEHIFRCVLCSARGFLCEYCQQNEIIYPWLNKIYRCDHCGVCYHRKCWLKMYEICSKCQRLNQRLYLLEDDI